MIQAIAKRTGGTAWSRKPLLGACLMVVAALLAACLLLAAKPAHAATSFTVNLPGDTHDVDHSDNLCDVNLFGSGEQCTLRAAMEQANATAGADAIRFLIPDTFGAGVKTINVGALDNTGLPTIKGQVSINGYTQPDTSRNTLAKGTNANLLIELNGTDAPGNGLEIGAGGSGSVIKGLVVNRFPGQGIEVINDGETNVRIEGNFVGTDPSGTIALGNEGDGMEIDASGSVVGGSTLASRNLISGNDVDGLSITSAKGVRVEGNLVGTEADGVGALGNLFNGVDVSGATATGNSILRNSIFSNGQLGIDLGVDGRTPNDLGDADSGANGLQNFPVLTSAKTVSAKTTIKGKLNSRPNAGYTLQFFSNPSGTNEGRTFVGQKSVTTDGSGTATFTFSLSSTVVAVGQTITATATKTSNGNTSEFSDPRTVAST
jgi:hypothetical protein